MNRKIIYCGGNFEFQYKDYSVDKIESDYRVEILGGDVNNLIHTPDNASKLRKIGRGVYYCGPYYFYEEGTDGASIVKNEIEMVNKCTNAVFVIDNTNIPGTITEIVHAATYGREVAIFYVKQPLDKGEPEKDICSANWYPIEFAKIMTNAYVVECEDREMAKQLAYNYVESIKMEVAKAQAIAAKRDVITVISD